MEAAESETSGDVVWVKLLKVQMLKACLSKHHVKMTTMKMTDQKKITHLLFQISLYRL